MVDRDDEETKVSNLEIHDQEDEGFMHRRDSGVARR